MGLYTRYLSSLAALGLPAVQPLGRVRCASKGILHTRNGHHSRLPAHQYNTLFININDFIRMHELGNGSVIASNYEILRFTTPFYYSALSFLFITPLYYSALSFMSVLFQSSPIRC